MRVAVLAGGRSSEHEVSLASAAAVSEGLRGAGHEVLAVDLERDGTWRHDGRPVALAPAGGLLGADAVFPALHGPFGEDGAVQGLLELLDVAYVGSGVAASAVCMDKLLAKDLLAAAGVAQVGYATVDEALFRARPGEAVAALELLGHPVWVKPARMGSSVGITRVGEGGLEYAAALDAAFAHDPRVIVEAHAGGLEVECAVLDGRPSEPGEIVVRTGSGWYDFEAKYTDGAMDLVVPARIPAAARDAVRALAARAFAVLGCAGLARADFFVDGDTVLLNELNTMPGFTRTSVFPKLWEASGVPFPALVDRLVRLAVARFERERSYRF